MSRQKKTRTGGVRAGERASRTDTDFTRNRVQTQPGTALSAYLDRYKFDLLTLPIDKHISRLVDACDLILDERGK